MIYSFSGGYYYPDSNKPVNGFKFQVSGSDNRFETVEKLLAKRDEFHANNPESLGELVFAYSDEFGNKHSFHTSKVSTITLDI